jgi:hypothetical protein
MRRGEGSTSSPAIACRRLYIARLGLRRRRWSCGRNFEEGRTTNAVGCSGSGFSSSFGFVWFAPRTPGAWLLRLDCAARRVKLAVGSIMDGCRDTKTKGAIQVFKFCFSLIKKRAFRFSFLITLFSYFSSSFAKEEVLFMSEYKWKYVFHNDG